jgi:preprotein translocase SecF subunit
MFLGIGCIAAGGLRFGIDFTGGTEKRVRFEQPMQEDAVRALVMEAGVSDPPVVQKATDQTFGEIVLIRTETLDSERAGQVDAALLAKGGQVLATDTFGPSIAREVAINAFWAVLAASLVIIGYLAIRFAIGGLANGLKYGVCAVIALLHDVITVTGLFALMGFLRGWQVDSLFVTAMLTVIGYSVHDTIVVYDRIRENLKNRQRGESFEEIANRSITQTFDRSINTGLTVMIVLAALLFWGGSVTKLFNLALLAGIVIGTYSSIFVAASLVVLWEKRSALAAVPAGGRRPADVRLATPTPSRRASESTVRTPAGVGAGPRNGGAGTSRDSADSEAESSSTTISPTRGGTIKPKRKRRM